MDLEIKRSFQDFEKGFPENKKHFERSCLS